MPMPSDSQRLRPAHQLILSAILLLAAALRFDGLGRQRLSIDELGTMETAAGRGQLHLILPRNQLLSPPPVVTRLAGAPPVWNVAPMMAADVHPALYFILLRLWQDAFGGGDAASRSLSAVAGVIGVLILFDVGRWIADPGVGLWAALLMALAGPLITIDRDARPYALAIVLILTAVDALLRLERLGPSRARMSGLAASVAAACLTHYFVLPVLIAMAAYAMIVLPQPARRTALAAFLAAGVLFLLLGGPLLALQRKNFTDPWMYWFDERTPDHAAMTLRRFAVLPLRYLAEPPTGSVAAPLAASLYALPWLLCRRNRRMVLPGLWLMGCAGLVGALDMLRKTHQLDLIKYSIFGAPAVYLLIPMLLAGRRPRNAVAGAAALYCAIALAGTILESKKGPPPDPAADLARLASPDDPVLFAGAGWGDWYTGTLYMSVERYARQMPPVAALLKAPVPPRLLIPLRGRRCWLLMAWTNQSTDLVMPGWRARKISNYADEAMLCEMTWPASVP